MILHLTDDLRIRTEKAHSCWTVQENSSAGSMHESTLNIRYITIFSVLSDWEINAG